MNLFFIMKVVNGGESSIVKRQSSIVNRQWSMLNGQSSIVNRQLSIVETVTPFALRTL